MLSTQNNTHPGKTHSGMHLRLPLRRGRSEAEFSEDLQLYLPVSVVAVVVIWGQCNSTESDTTDDSAAAAANGRKC